MKRDARCEARSKKRLENSQARREGAFCHGAERTGGTEDHHRDLKSAGAGPAGVSAVSLAAARPDFVRVRFPRRPFS